MKLPWKKILAWVGKTLLNKAREEGVKQIEKMERERREAERGRRAPIDPQDGPLTP